MGWFNNPDCPRCGKETTIVRATFEKSYYTCRPCVQKARKEKQEKEDLIKRIEELERASNGKPIRNNSDSRSS